MPSVDRNLPSTYQQVLENMDTAERLSVLVEGDGTTDNPGLAGLINGYTDPDTGEHVDGIADIVLPDPDDPEAESLEERVVDLETSYDASKVISVNGSQLPLSVIPQSALERIYDVPNISVMADRSSAGYPTEAGNGDTIRDTGDDNRFYFISDATVLGTVDYMNGLKPYSAGYAANAGLVNNHSVQEDVPSGAKFTDTVTSAYCMTTADSAAKTAICDHYVLAAGNWLQILIAYSNAATSLLNLNVNGTGAKPIYINDKISSATNCALPAGCYFAYYGTRTIDGTSYTGYWFRTDGNLPNINVKEVEIDVMTGATATTDGASGLVPQPKAGDQDKVLSGAGTWVRHASVDIVSSETMPVGQQSGDYWLQTLTDI